MFNTRYRINKVTVSLFCWSFLFAYQPATAQQSEQDPSKATQELPQSVRLEQIFDLEDQSQKHVGQDTDRCVFATAKSDWITGARESAHGRLCRTAMWLDGLFGDEHDFNDKDFTGKLSVGFKYDETDGFDPRLRVRINTRLPNVSSRFNAFVGRVDEDSYISNTEVDDGRVTTVGLRSTNVQDDDEWLVGLGYQNPNKRENGFDYSIGAKLSSGLSGYAKVTHRHLFKPNDLSYWRTTQTGFWRRNDGFGVSSRLDYTRLLSDRDILEWDTSLKYTEESEQWEWITGTSWHHSITEKRGVSSRIYLRGEQENEVSIPEYGITFTYVRPFFKPWLLVELGVDLRFEKEFRDSSYDSVIRYGIEFEMLLGDFYGREKVKPPKIPTE